MEDETNIEKFEKLLRQIKVAIELIDTEYEKQQIGMLELIRKRYYDAINLLENNSIVNLKEEMFFIKGGARSYLEASSNYITPMLDEMYKAEKLLDDIFH